MPSFIISSLTIKFSFMSWSFSLASRNIMSDEFKLGRVVLGVDSRMGIPADSAFVGGCNTFFLLLFDLRICFEANIVPSFMIRFFEERVFLSELTILSFKSRYFVG